MKISLNIFMVFSLLPFTFLLGKGDSINQDWYSNALENIKTQEYHITYSEKINTYQAPNRKNNLRFIFKNDGFSVSPRVTEIFNIDENDPLSERVKIKVSDNWGAEFTVLGYGRNGVIERKFNGEEIIAKENIAFVKDKNMKVDYINNKDGMRQNFTIHSKPKSKNGLLTLSLEVKTEEQIMVGADALVIKSRDAKEYMKYNSLRIWDANGKELRGWFKETNNNVNEETKEIQIVVNDLDANYPIIIDPLSTTENWSVAGTQNSSSFGNSASTAGDVNGDGFSDLIIGDPTFDNGETNEGAVFVYYGSVSGLSNIVGWSAEGGQANASFGNTVATAGDVNGDGYSDIIIGAYLFDSGETDEGKTFVYHGSSSGLSLNPNWTTESDQGSAQLGISISTAGDVNGDGYSDVIIGANLYNSGNTNEGKTFVYHGSSSGLSTTANWTAESNQVDAEFGTSVATAGDVNGDGYSDVIIGGKNYNHNQTDNGKVSVYFGSARGLSILPNWVKHGEEDDSNFGGNVSTAGDVNGDGFSDIIIVDVNGIYLYSGSQTGLSSNIKWSSIQSIGIYDSRNSVSCAGDVNGDGYADIIIGSWLDEKVEIFFGSDSGLSYFSNGDFVSNYGYCVSAAGDVNGDGYSDIVVTDPRGDGSVHVYHGAIDDGFSDMENWKFEGNQSGANFGYSVSTAGDVNADGYSDIIVGAPLYDSGNNNEGKVFLFNGSGDGLSTTPSWSAEGNLDGVQFGKTVATAGDVNGDGLSDLIIGMPNYNISVGRVTLFYGSTTNLSSTPDWIFDGSVGESFLGSSVSTAGDVNGDGYSDVIIGTGYFDNSQLGDEGIAYVFHGSDSGLASSANWSREGNQPGENYGSSVSLAGDVNGDGYSDIIVGSPNYTNDQIKEGKAYIYHGSSIGLSITPNYQVEGDNEYAYLGCSVSTIGDWNGDGYSDVIIGCKGLFNSAVLSNGSAFIRIGSESGLYNPSILHEYGAVGSFAEGFGTSVSSAGDVNGDGYDDFIVGGHLKNDAEGVAYLFLGKAFPSYTYGASVTQSNTEFSGSASNQEYGYSVSTAGDVNGDGYSDIIIGAPKFDSGNNDEGAAFVFYGNNGGLDRRIQQFKPNSNNIISAGGLSETNGSVQLGLRSKSPYGRDFGRLVYEYKENGEPFSSGNDGTIGSSTAYSGKSSPHDLGINPSGTLIKAEVNGLAPDKTYKWRARVEYNLMRYPFQRFGPWRYYKSYAAKLAEGFKANVIILSLTILADIKIILEGPYSTANDNMNTNLTGNIPATSPYTEDPVTASSIPGFAVDWVLVELRDKTDETNVLVSKSGFLMEDKTIRDLDGTSPLSFSLPEDDYYIAVKHRNHLPVMSANPVSLTAN